MQKPSNSDIETVGTRSFDVLWASVVKAPKVCRPEDGWLTTAQIAAKFGITERLARRRMDAAVQSGEVERELTAGERGHLTVFFRPIDKHARKPLRK